MSKPETHYVTTAGILVETSLGSLVFDLYGCDCPGLTANYANLCRCHFWNGAIATEVIPGAAIFFSHAADPVYDALLGEAATPNDAGDLTRGFCGSFWNLLRHCSEERWRLEAERQLRTQKWDAAREREVSMVRSCEGIANLTTSSGVGGSPKLMFRTAGGALDGRRHVGSLCRRGLLIINTSSTASSSGAVRSSDNFRFGITLSDRHLDFLEDQYVAIGQISEGFNVLSGIRRAPHAEGGDRTRWPRPLRMLRIKHTKVLPTPGVEAFSSRASPDRAAGPLQKSLQRGLHAVGCFAHWAPLGAISEAARHLARQIVVLSERYHHTPAATPEEAVAALTSGDSPAQPFVLPPRLTDEIPSPEYNAHYKGNYLSSDEEDLTSSSASSAAEQRKRRQAVLDMHREQANTTLALMLNLLNGVADVDVELKPPENVLFVCKLNPVTTGDGLAMCFAQFGRVLSAEVVMDKKTKRSLCYGFVEFDTVDACYRAFQKMDRALIDDSRIHVDFSQSVSKLWFQKQREMRKRSRET
ncbi:unnamed protein product [Phytomonas sp. Hart1]|nr:unnamed protein product [Phytomonas sp. Hart1]|eukprot:CCW71699.1 unnamed protein product [Phytomonas sp. isolate Hart1]